MEQHRVTIYPGEDGYFVAEAIDLPCVSQGRTREEALKNITEAIEGYLAAVQDHAKDSFPKIRTPIIVEA